MKMFLKYNPSISALENLPFSNSMKSFLILHSCEKLLLTSCKSKKSEQMFVILISDVTIYRGLFSLAFQAECSSVDMDQNRNYTWSSLWDWKQLCQCVHRALWSLPIRNTSKLFHLHKVWFDRGLQLILVVIPSAFCDWTDERISNKPAGSVMRSR